MKKITLAFALLTFAVQAQDFPSPYCSVEDTDVEAITEITFAGTTITNTDITSILVDKTSTEVTLVPGDTYTLTVKGDTNGNFDNKIVAYIDWNKNGILNDDGEVFIIGTIFNSTGNDEISVSADITVPSDAVEEPTRIRITKIYQDNITSAVDDPCAIDMEIPDYGIFPGFGQALDFTVIPEQLSINSFEVSAFKVYPIPTQNILNVSYKSELNAVRVFNLLGQEVMAQNTTSTEVQMDLSSLAAGAYIVKVFSNDGEHNFRAIKQ